MKPTSNVLSLPLKASNRVHFLQTPLLKVLKAAQGHQARSPARGCWKEDVRGLGEQRRAASGSDWFLRPPPSPSPPTPPPPRPSPSAEEAVLRRPPSQQLCRGRPLAALGRFTEKPRWGSRPPPGALPAPPDPAGPWSGRPRATAGRRPWPCPLPGPRAYGLDAAGGVAGAEKRERGSSPSPGAGSPEGGADVRGPTEASLRHPWRGLRAGIAGGIAGGALSWGRLPCRGDGSEARGTGSCPAAETHGFPPCAPWSRVPRLSGGPFRSEGTLSSRHPTRFYAGACTSSACPPTFFAWAGAGVLPLPSSRPRLNVTHQGP